MMPCQAGKRHLFDGDVMSFQIEIKPTERGFMRGEFKDLDGNVCLIQDSSLATDYALRLGQLEGIHHNGHCLATMHLTKEMAKTIIQALMRFVNNGTIAEVEQIDKDIFAEMFSEYMRSTEALAKLLRRQSIGSAECEMERLG